MTSFLISASGRRLPTKRPQLGGLGSKYEASVKEQLDHGCAEAGVQLPSLPPGTQRIHRDDVAAEHMHRACGP